MRRRVIVAATLLIGAVLLGLSLTRPPGGGSFYWLTFALAAVWAGGAVLSGPLRAGSAVGWRGRTYSPAQLGLAAGVAVSAAFVLGALVVREIDALAAPITRVLEFANQGALPLVVVITLINGAAEELFFRGALYSALDETKPVRAIAFSTLVYVVVTLAAGNPMLGFAAVLLGTLCALLRRATGGVLAPVLTHLLWGLTMVLVLPPLMASIG